MSDDVEIYGAGSTEAKAVAIVKRDFNRASKYLEDFHKAGVDRYKHYIAPGMSTNLDKDKSFPVPFTTEQVDTLIADMMEKIWYKDEPCSIYGPNEEDISDADAKREFMKYQDDKDDLHSKMRQAIFHCCIYKIAPAVVNYKEEYIDVVEEQASPLLDALGRPVLGLDGETPLSRMEQVPVRKFTYQGATVELVDPIDFFWVPEKRDIEVY